MKISLQDEYKSLQPFVSEDLSNFVVITGKNGSGKSQLLRLITKKNENNPEIVSTRIDFDPPIHKIQTEGIIKNTSIILNHDHWKAIVENKFKIYKQLTPAKKDLIRYVMEAKKNGDFNHIEQDTLLSSSADYLIKLKKAYAEIYNTPLDKLVNISNHHQKNAFKSLFNSNNILAIEFANAVSTYTHKAEEELTEADFYNAPHDESLIDVNDLFASQIEIVFYNYAKRRHENTYKYFQKKEYGDKNDSINDNEFLQKFRPPWEIINEIFTQNNLDFYFRGLDRGDYSRDVNVEFQLYKKSSNQTIPFTDLSSGEQVIIGLILKLFVTEYYELS